MNIRISRKRAKKNDCSKCPAFYQVDDIDWCWMKNKELLKTVTCSKKQKDRAKRKKEEIDNLVVSFENQVEITIAEYFDNIMNTLKAEHPELFEEVGEKIDASAAIEERKEKKSRIRIFFEKIKKLLRRL